MAALPSMMSTFFVPMGKEIGDCWDTEPLQAFWRRAFRKAELPLRSGRYQKDLNLDSSYLFPKGAGGSAAPNRTRKPACLPQAATRAAVFCKVEVASSKFRTSGVPSTTFGRAFSTSG